MQFRHAFAFPPLRLQINEDYKNTYYNLFIGKADLMLEKNEAHHLKYSSNGSHRYIFI